MVLNRGSLRQLSRFLLNFEVPVFLFYFYIIFILLSSSGYHIAQTRMNVRNCSVSKTIETWTLTSSYYSQVPIKKKTESNSVDSKYRESGFWRSKQGYSQICFVSKASQISRYVPWANEVLIIIIMVGIIVIASGYISSYCLQTYTYSYIFIDALFNV